MRISDEGLDVLGAEKRGVAVVAVRMLVVVAADVVLRSSIACLPMFI